VSNTDLQQYFSSFRKGIIGIESTFSSPYGANLPLIYADWTASGRMYKPIEDKLMADFLPLVANTHTETNYTGSVMTGAYHEAMKIIKEHVNAYEQDVLISSGSGMTAVVNKLQRILGLRIHEKYMDRVSINDNERPVVFVSHMEHHSNQTSWLETIAEVIIVEPDSDGLVSVENFSNAIDKYANRPTKIVAMTACSNVTGIFTPYMDIAQLIHKSGGLCFVDFACCAPYVDMNMHEDDSNGRYLDAIYFSPHKFLGGPGSTGILLFNQNLYHNNIPDNPGGGTVEWTNPWGGHRYVTNIEAREDGGTPAFLQTIRVALCIKLKNEMGTAKIKAREEEILHTIFSRLEKIPNLHILAGQHHDRLGVISFYIDNLHYNFGVKLLNDRFGIQTRGGCSCAGTYGHFLLNVSPNLSSSICSMIDSGDLSEKPGWIRMSIHPTHTDDEINYMCDAVEALANNFKEWESDYVLDFHAGSIKHKSQPESITENVLEEMFSF